MNIGVYIQVPFCQTKCTYCNFHTGVVSRERYEPYANAVCREIGECDAGLAAALDTIYLGGGTPSLLNPPTLERILSATQGKFNGNPVEVTLEADPETVACEKADAWLRAGFNRISLGAQSFQDEELKASGRMHRRGDIYAAVQALRAAGFHNISMDLIAGLPHQTRESWDESIEELLRLRPEHVSIYMLEIDEGSRLGKESLAGGSRYSADAIPSDDAIAEFYERACERLGAEGYEHYEISNWALEGRRSQHNLKYWRREPYFGFGAGAHSFDGRRRWANVHDSAQYVSSIERGISPRQNVETVSPAQALEEELFLGLRQIGGIDLARIERDYRVNLRARVEALRREGLVELRGSWLRLAPGRLTVSNEVFVELLG
ncbi:MAG TPA: radical SAM family heme chaperone HemW [Candidatus Sulfotelmatobacter sp.]|nr:radical SAM family heme chaperone HemW [Candidatus Sulfotelmatobacter sp.]